MPIVKLRTNRQLTLPASICEAAQLEIGDFVDVQFDGEIISLYPKRIVDKKQPHARVMPNENRKGLARIYGMVKEGGGQVDYSVNHDKYLAETHTNEKRSLAEIPVVVEESIAS
jgi:bifunctional DNA-binding transcriptional regulator/antitoxin component of YhaV-PrlF toxin-antitoxin module